MKQYIQWNGLNLEDVQKYVEPYFSVKRSDNNDNNLLISLEDNNGIPYEDVVELNQFLYLDDDQILAIIDENDIEEFVEEIKSMNEEDKKDESFVSGLSDLFSPFKDEKLTQHLQQVDKHLTEFLSTLTNDNEYCEKQSDIKEKANQFKHQSVYHVKRVSNDVFHFVSTKVDNLKDKHASKKADQHQLFEQLRNDNKYDGLSDDELKRLVYSRMLFK